MKRGARWMLGLLLTGGGAALALILLAAGLRSVHAHWAAGTQVWVQTEWILDLGAGVAAWADVIIAHPWSWAVAWAALAVGGSVSAWRGAKPQTLRLCLALLLLLPVAWMLEDPRHLLWVASLVTAALMLGAYGWRLDGRPDADRLSRAVRVLLLGLILTLATWMRVYRLDVEPFGIHDEPCGEALYLVSVLNGVPGAWRELLWGHRPLTWYGTVSELWALAVFHATGVSPLAYRLTGVLAGIVALSMVYVLSRAWFGARAALLTALLMGLAPWCVFFSRSNLPLYMVAVAQASVAYAVLWQAWTRGALWWFPLAGVAMGLSLYVYEAGRMTILGTGLTCLLLGWRYVRSPGERRWRIVTVRMLLIFGVLVGVLAPWMRWGLNDPMYLLSSGGSVNAHKAAWTSTERMDLPERVGTNLRLTIRMLAASREGPPHAMTDDYFARRGEGLLDRATLILAMIGMGISLGACRRPPHAILLIWTLTGLIVALVTAPMPKRLTPLMPPLFIWAGLGADALCRAMGVWRWAWCRRGALALLGLALTLYAGYQVRASLVRMPPGNATLHPDFTAHRVALIDAARDGRLVTDVSTSILRMTLMDLPTVRVSDLRGRFGEVLEQAREETRGVTLLADPRRQGNREMMEQLRVLSPEGRWIDSDDFILLGFSAADWRGLYTPAPPTTLPADSGAPERYAHTAAYFASAAMRVAVRDVSGAVSELRMDAAPLVSRKRSDGGVEWPLWLTPGMHALTFVTSRPQLPELVWAGARPPDRFHDRLSQLPFMAGAKVRIAPLRWRADAARRLDAEPALKGPVHLHIDTDGMAYVTDNGDGTVRVFDRTGRQVRLLRPERVTLAAAMGEADGAILVMRPHAARSLARYDAAGVEQGLVPVHAKAVAWDPAGRIFLLRENGRQVHEVRFGDRPGVVATWTIPGQTGGLTLVGGADPGVHVLLGDGRLVRLNAALQPVEERALPSMAVGAKPRLALDADARLYLLNPGAKQWTVFDRDGAMLVIDGPDSNGPPRLEGAVDITFAGGQLHVLGRLAGTHTLWSFTPMGAGE